MAYTPDIRHQVYSLAGDLARDHGKYLGLGPSELAAMKRAGVV